MPATPNRSNNPTQTTTSGEGEFSNFVEGLGPGQIVGRQALAASNLGDIQLSLHDRKGHLEVEVIRARGLQSTKQKSKIIPGKLSIVSIVSKLNVFPCFNFSSVC